MERQKQTTEGGNKKRKKKKKQVEKSRKQEESKYIDKNKSKTESSTIEYNQVEDSFALFTRHLDGILTPQQLYKFRKVHEIHEELGKRGAPYKITESLRSQYGSISMTVVAYEKRLITGWSDRLAKLRALKQKHQVDATKKEIIIKFQKALVQKKTLHARKKKKRPKVNEYCL